MLGERRPIVGRRFLQARTSDDSLTQLLLWIEACFQRFSDAQ